MNSGSLLLSRSEVSRLLDLGECMNAVESAFRSHDDGSAPTPGILGIHAQRGGLHIKAGLMNLRRSYFVAKVNSNFPGNIARGFPTIQGVVIISDAENGRLLALIDSIELTIVRTGAATGIAAKHLARSDARTISICGCGNQGRIS